MQAPIKIEAADAYAVFALDRASVRSFDGDGHLHVELTNISKATVNPYLGSEIPGWDELGLDPDRTYQLYRDPEELEKAAKSFNGKPLLFLHKPTTAEDHDHETVVGAVSNVIWEAPYLKASLAVWPSPAIDVIQSGQQKELSSAYRYKADMRPGSINGVKYDGVMRDIIGNHVALVKEGRAGPDVVVGDSKQGFINMTQAVLTRKAAVAQGALLAFIRPKLAQDAKIDIVPMLKGVTAKNYVARKGKIAHDFKKVVAGKLAQDAEIDTDDLEKILEVVEALSDDGDDLYPENGIDNGAAEDDDDAQLRSLLKAKGMSDEDIDKICGSSAAPAADAEKDDDNDKKTAADADKDDDEDDDKKKKDKNPFAKDKGNMVTKTAMDAAIAAAKKDATRDIATAVKVAADTATKTQSDIREAERAVRPWVGELSMSFDSASAVHRQALKMLGVEGAANLHPDALLPILQAQPKPGDRQKKPTTTAMDEASVASFATRYPAASNIRML